MKKKDLLLWILSIVCTVLLLSAMSLGIAYFSARNKDYLTQLQDYDKQEEDIVILGVGGVYEFFDTPYVDIVVVWLDGVDNVETDEDNEWITPVYEVRVQLKKVNNRYVLDDERFN